jgi:hypothetical protein
VVSLQRPISTQAVSADMPQHFADGNTELVFSPLATAAGEAMRDEAEVDKGECLSPLWVGNEIEEMTVVGTCPV